MNILSKLIAVSFTAGLLMSAPASAYTVDEFNQSFGPTAYAYVEYGVATVTGYAADETEKKMLDSAAKKIEGVETVRIDVLVP